jgi:hypothetical protein
MANAVRCVFWGSRSGSVTPLLALVPLLFRLCNIVLTQIIHQNK